MGKHSRVVAVVGFLVAVIAGLPWLMASAAAQPRAVTVATRDLAPFVMTDDGIKSGFTVDILAEIANRKGWSINYLDVDSVGAQLQAVADRRADAAAGAISITADRMNAFDFSQPILNAGLQILIPDDARGPSSPGLIDFLKLLFSKTMLVWLGAALILTVIPAHIAWLAERRHANSMVSKSYFPGIFQAFGWSLGMLAAQPDDAPRHWMTRSMALLWAFVSIIFVAYYTATLTANLTVAKFDAQISSPADLFDKRVCTVADTTSAVFLTGLGVGFDGRPAIEDCYAGLRRHEFDAAVFDSPVLSYYVANEGKASVELAGPVFQTEDYGIAFRTGDELRKQIDAMLLTLREDGTDDLIKAKWFDTDEGAAMDGGG